MFILAARSLRHASKILLLAWQKCVWQSCIAILGISFNHNAVKVRKTCQYQLDHYLSNRNDIFSWYDAINNSIKRHCSNKFNALTPNQLKKIFLLYEHNFYAIAYCKRLGTEDIYSKLKESGILIIIIVTDLISRRKQNLTELGQRYFLLHQYPSLELKTFTIFRRYSNKLIILFQRKIPLSRKNASAKLIETKKMLSSNCELSRVLL